MVLAWLRRFFYSDDPEIKIAGGLGEHEAKMVLELLRSDGISAVIKNMKFLSVAYGASVGNEYDLWVKASEETRAREIVAAAVSEAQLIEPNEDEAPPDEP